MFLCLLLSAGQRPLVGLMALERIALPQPWVSPLQNWRHVLPQEPFLLHQPLRLFSQSSLSLEGNHSQALGCRSSHPFPLSTVTCPRGRPVGTSLRSSSNLDLVLSPLLNFFGQQKTQHAWTFYGFHSKTLSVPGIQKPAVLCPALLLATFSFGQRKVSTTGGTQTSFPIMFFHV